MKMQERWRDKQNVIRAELQRLDPYGLLASGAPQDEFDGEAAGIARLVTCQSSPEEIAQAFAAVLSRAFGQQENPADYMPSALRIQAALSDLHACGQEESSCIST